MTALQPGDKALLPVRLLHLRDSPNPYPTPHGFNLAVVSEETMEALGDHAVVVDAKSLTPVPSLEDVARTMYDHRESIADAIDGWTAWEDLPESWREEWRDAAREVMRLFGVGEDE